MVFPDALVMPSDDAVIEAVSKNKNAIGYIRLGAVKQAVKVLKLNGIQGSEETTQQGTYPVSRPLFMFTNGWPEGDTLNFINFILCPGKGQKCIRETGFVPLY